MPRKLQPPCEGCGITFEAKALSKYCTPLCRQRTYVKLLIKPARKVQQAIPRPCSSPDCGNTITGRLSLKYCSAHCAGRASYLRRNPRQTPEQVQRIRAKRTAKDHQTFPHCSICGKSTVKSAFYNPKLKSQPMIPQGVNLCTGHTKGYSHFLLRNQYYGYDPDEIFAAYLVRLAMGHGKDPRLTLMREAFHANK